MKIDAASGMRVIHPEDRLDLGELCKATPSK